MPRLTPLQWLICAIAALGFAFDIYEVLMAPLVVGPAIGELTGFKPGTPDFNFWVGMFFWVPALVGGAFGLLGGYLTDRFGRRRVLVWSILLYAFSAMAAGYSTSITMLLVLRSTTYIGVFVEFVAAVAWVAEIFDDPKQREAALGYTQAFSSIGGLMVTGAYAIAVTYSQHFPEIAGGHSPWRYTLISGVIPALPLILIRPFLPESPAWQAKKAAGTLKRPSLAAIFTPQLRRTTIVTTIMFACAYGAAFGAIQQMPRIVPGPSRGADDGAAAATADGGGRAGISRSGRAGGTLRAGFPRPPHRLAPEADSAVPGAGSDRRATGLCLCGQYQPGPHSLGHVLRRVLHRGAVQFLGELSAARLPNAFARHGRGFRRQHRRPYARHRLRVRDDAAGERDAGLVATDEAGVRRRGCGRVRVWRGIGLLPYLLPEPRSADLPE